MNKTNINIYLLKYYNMNLAYSNNDLDEFMENVYFDGIVDNDGGMNINDMFSFYFLLKKMQPTTIIECGIWNGFSTKLIRKTLGDNCKIICSDPRSIPSSGYTDNNSNTKYFTGNSFIDFKDFILDDNLNFDKTLCFFDDHQNSAQRLIQCMEKGIKHVFFNDNYPLNAGSHYSIQHLLDNDLRKVFDIENQYNYSINVFPQIDLNKRHSLIKKIDEYIVFPNIFPSKITLYEGTFDSIGFFKEDDETNIKKYSVFYKKRGNYCWNTYLTIN